MADSVLPQRTAFRMADWFDSYQADDEGLCCEQCAAAAHCAPLCLNSCCFSYIETIIKTSSQRIVQCAATTRPTILWLIQSSLNDVGTTILLFTFPFKKPSMLSELQVSTGFRHLKTWSSQLQLSHGPYLISSVNVRSRLECQLSVRIPPCKLVNPREMVSEGGEGKQQLGNAVCLVLHNVLLTGRIQ